MQRTFSALGKLRCWLDCVFFLWVEFGGGGGGVTVTRSLLFTLAILRFHLFDIVTCSHSFHTLLVLLFYKCSLVPICNFVSYSYLNWKPAQHWCSDCCPVTVPAKSHRYVFLQVEFKNKTPFLATLRDFCLSGLRRVFAGPCKFQVVVDASPRCHSGPSTEIYSVILAVKWCKSSKTKACIKLLQTTAQALEICSFLFDSRAKLRHIALTTPTAMPCAPRSHLVFGDRDR